MSRQKKINPDSGKDSIIQPAKNNVLSISRQEYDSLKKQAREAAENWDKLLRAQAEFENIKKRLEKEKQDFVRFANEDLIADLLMVLDDLERSIELAQQNKGDPQAFLKGIELILGHLYEILKKRGLTPIEIEGKPFDPQLHEALLHIETDDVPEHTIVEELQRGYLLNDRVIRTAKVKISKKKIEDVSEKDK